MSGFGGSVNDRFVSCVALPAMTSSVTTARRHTRTLLEEWGLLVVVDDAEVVVSEMVTNAIKATNLLPGSASCPDQCDRLEVVCLCLCLDGGDLVIEVWDPRYEAPKRRDVDLYDEGGRGLWLIGALSGDWGVRWPPTGGKTVWARLSRRDGRQVAGACPETPAQRAVETPTRTGAETPVGVYAETADVYADAYPDAYAEAYAEAPPGRRSEPM